MDWVRRELDAYELSQPDVAPREMVAVVDCVFFGRTMGYLVVRDPYLKENVYWHEIASETLEEYLYARDTLEAQGFVIQAIVADGKPGLKPIYKDIPIQMCHFHQQAIIRRYITTRPKLEAGKELKELVKNLGKYCEKCFARELATWHRKWHEFLNERTLNPETNKRPFTHKRLRSAYRSLKTNLPYLFTYKKHPELHMPNTTNGLEGLFAYLKELVRVHRGIKPGLKRKIIKTILQKAIRKPN